MTPRSTLARTLALCLGSFTLLNVLGDVLHPGFDANLWWIDLRALPPIAGQLLLLALGSMLVHYAVRPCMAWRLRAVTMLLAAGACAMAIVNAATFFALVAGGRIDAGIPLPLSLIIAPALALMVYDMHRSRREPAANEESRPPLRSRLFSRHGVIACATLAAVALGFPLAQMFFFGKTDYTRHAEVIIVPGARAYADGQPSIPLADRVRTACDLYHAGYAPLLIFSGGPGDGDVHETESMRDLAISLGVPAYAIVLDREGLSTQATAENTSAVLGQLDLRRALVVSHFYHLPRLKLAYQRLGREVFTVPARESYTLRALPGYITREVAAIWWYYLNPLW